MSVSAESMIVKEPATAQRCVNVESTTWRSPFHLSDIWKAPLHDFPIRDEILCQFFPFSRDMEVLEIGPGSGFTAYWLSRVVKSMTLLDVTSETIAELHKELQPNAGLSLVAADITREGLAIRLRQQFDAAFGLDVFEYLADPATSLHNLAEVLRPGGQLFLAFPNVPPPQGDGVTYFNRLDEIEGLLEQAGFLRWDVFTVRPRPFATAAYQLLHERPLAILRSMRRIDRDSRPQTYERTWAFRHRLHLNRFKFLLHLYWTWLGRVIRLGGPVFTHESATDEILGEQIVIRAWK
jgi:SAM-dependent methyltransferase